MSVDRWRLVVDPDRPNPDQMGRDEELAQEAAPTARFFLWSPPAVSLGRRQSRPDWLRDPARRCHPVDCVERPTGGGLAFHGSDVSLSVILPRDTAAPLRTLMQAVCGSAVSLCRSYGVKAVAELDAPSASRITYCLAEPSPFAIRAGERKLAGFAIRRYPRAWLIQGSLLVRPLPQALTAVLPPAVQAQLRDRAWSLAEASRAAITETQAAERWASHWSGWWGEMISPIQREAALSA